MGILHTTILYLVSPHSLEKNYIHIFTKVWLSILCSLHYSSNRSSPLLLASSSGALAAVKCLIDLGAYVLRKDDNGNNVIHLAALRFHTNVLEFFIQWAHPDVPVWRLLVGKNRVKYTDTLIFRPLPWGGGLFNVLQVWGSCSHSD